MKECFELRKLLEQTRQELSHTLYQHDAACRVIGRVIKERDEARRELAEASAKGAQRRTRQGRVPVWLSHQKDEDARREQEATGRARWEWTRAMGGWQADEEGKSASRVRGGGWAERRGLWGAGAGIALVAPMAAATGGAAAEDAMEVEDVGISDAVIAARAVLRADARGPCCATTRPRPRASLPLLPPPFRFFALFSSVCVGCAHRREPGAGEGQDDGEVDGAVQGAQEARSLWCGPVTHAITRAPTHVCARALSCTHKRARTHAQCTQEARDR